MWNSGSHCILFEILQAWLVTFCLTLSTMRPYFSIITLPNKLVWLKYSILIIRKKFSLRQFQLKWFSLSQEGYQGKYVALPMFEISYNHSIEKLQCCYPLERRLEITEQDSGPILRCVPFAFPWKNLPKFDHVLIL